MSLRIANKTIAEVTITTKATENGVMYKY